MGAFKEARFYTIDLMTQLEDGFVDKDYVLNALLKYMSDEEVRDCMRMNCIMTLEELDEEMAE